MHSKLLKALFSIVASAASAGAFAHTGVDAHVHTGFLAGFVHPLTGLDHFAAMISVGVWSALTARRFGPALFWGPLGFATLLIAGAGMGLQGVAIPAVEPMIAASLLMFGLLVASQLTLPGLGAAALVGCFAMFHGLAHGYELAGNDSAIATLTGMLSATALLHCIGLGMGWSLRQRSVWAPRLIGSGVFFLGGALLLDLV
jgi:urease accessory protein